MEEKIKKLFEREIKTTPKNIKKLNGLSNHIFSVENDKFRVSIAKILSNYDQTDPLRDFETRYNKIWENDPGNYFLLNKINN